MPAIGARSASALVEGGAMCQPPPAPVTEPGLEQSDAGDIDSLRQEVMDLTNQGSALQDCIEHLERLLRESVDHTCKWQAVVGNRLEHVEHVIGESASKHQKWEDSHAQLAKEKEAHDAHRSSVAERLRFIEERVGDLVDQHGSTSQATNALLEDKEARHALHASLAVRIKFLEDQLGDVTETEETPRSSDVLEKKQTLESQCASILNRLTDLESQTSQLATRYSQESRQSSDACERNQTFDVQYASILDRLTDLESQTTDLANRYSQDNQSLDALHASVLDRLTELDSQTADVANRYLQVNEAVVKENIANESQHAAVAERLQALESHVFGELAERVGQDLQAVHARLDNSDGQVESIIRDFSEKAEKLEAAHQNIGEEYAARTAHHVALQAQIDGFERERFQALERALGELAEKQVVSEEQHRQLNTADVEGFLQASAEKYFAGALNELLTIERKGREAHERAVHSHLIGEKKSQGDARGVHARAVEHGEGRASATLRLRQRAHRPGEGREGGDGEGARPPCRKLRQLRCHVPCVIA